MSIEKWFQAAKVVDYAFQPIVNISTGKVVAYEALLRHWDKAGFESIDHFFNAAYEDQVLHRIDLILREKALRKFTRAELHEHARLFYNIDSRIIEMYDYRSGETARIMEELGLSKNIITFEISEKYEFKSFVEIKSIFNLYQQQGFQISLDDFGIGFSGLKLLYHSEPEYIKIDRFFITDVFKDTKKRLFVTNIINIAHSIGAIVIAEGVETKEEFYMCKEIGCDCVQGFYVAHPETQTDKLKKQYESIKELAKNDKRTKGDKGVLKKYLKQVESIRLDTKMEEIFEIFKSSNYSHVVVVDDLNRAVGILQEKNLRKYIYNPYGNSLLANKKIGEKLGDFVTECSSVEINTDIAKIIKAFSFNNKAGGVIVTKNFEYHGFIDAKNILEYLSQKDIVDARNQNPLSKLPGNKNVEEFMLARVEEHTGQVLFTYFDFNDFKPYNDTYGFRNGDRVILLFADILRRRFKKSNYFIGHIGGDDFFMGCVLGDDHGFETAAADVAITVERFEKDVESFYETKDKERGYIEAKDRIGRSGRFPLLSVSAASLTVDFDRLKGKIDEDDIATLMTSLKKCAKKAPDHMIFSSWC